MAFLRTRKSAGGTWLRDKEGGETCGWEMGGREEDGVTWREGLG